MKKQLEKLKKFWKLIFGRTGILVFLLLVQGLDQMAPVPFQVAEARLIVGQGIVLCLAFRRAASVKEFIMHVFRSFPLLMLLS